MRYARFGHMLTSTPNKQVAKWNESASDHRRRELMADITASLWSSLSSLNEEGSDTRQRYLFYCVPRERVRDDTELFNS